MTGRQTDGALTVWKQLSIMKIINDMNNSPMANNGLTLQPKTVTVAVNRRLRRRLYSREGINSVHENPHGRYVLLCGLGF